jgi:hypothetical protein
MWTDKNRAKYNRDHLRSLSPARSRSACPNNSSGLRFNFGFATRDDVEQGHTSARIRDRCHCRITGIPRRPRLDLPTTNAA